MIDWKKPEDELPEVEEGERRTILYITKSHYGIMYGDCACSNKEKYIVNTSFDIMEIKHWTYESDLLKTLPKEEEPVPIDKIVAYTSIVRINSLLGPVDVNIVIIEEVPEDYIAYSFVKDGRLYDEHIINFNSPIPYDHKEMANLIMKSKGGVR